jgi:DNA-binding transcriptional ArsR family regulator
MGIHLPPGSGRHALTSGGPQAGEARPRTGPESASRARRAVSTRALTAGTGISRQAVTKHLDVLAKAGVVSSEKSGRERLWVLETARLARAARRLERISEHRDEAPARRKAMVE